jgi:NitT/TauT family transport system substrate-binding protein
MISQKLTSAVLSFLLLGVLPLSLPAQDKIPLRVAMGDVSINKVPYLVALDNGLFAKHGLDVTLRPFSRDAAEDLGVPTDVLDTIPSGEYQMSIGGGAPMMVDRAYSSEPNDRIIVATTDHVVHWDILAKPGIDTLEELKGKRIGVSSMGACTGIVIQIIADRMGWDVDKDLAVLTGSYGVRTLDNDWVDALIAYDVPLSQGIFAGYQPMKIDMRSWNEAYPCNGVSVSRAWAEANRPTVIAFLKAVVEAISLMKQDKTYAFRSMEKWYGFDDPEQLQIIYDGAVDMPKLPFPAVAGVKRVMELYDTGPMNRFKPEDFYDESYMKEIEQSGFVETLYK